VHKQKTGLLTTETGKKKILTSFFRIKIKQCKVNKNSITEFLFLFKKNFRLFLNEYRIKEAQRLFSVPDAGKYKIEAVGNEVGFKSPNAFRRAFTEITGVSPSFYLNSMLKVKDNAWSRKCFSSNDR